MSGPKRKALKREQKEESAYYNDKINKNQSLNKIQKVRLKRIVNKRTKVAFKADAIRQEMGVPLASDAALKNPKYVKYSDKNDALTKRKLQLTKKMLKK